MEVSKVYIPTYRVFPFAGQTRQTLVKGGSRKQEEHAWEKPDASEKEVDGEAWMAEIGWIRWLYW